MLTFKLGKDAKIYQGMEETPLMSLTEITNVRDVTLSLEAGEADITTRANSGWRATAPTLRECSVEFEMVWQSGDMSFDAIKTAFLTGALLEMAILDGPKEGPSVQGVKGTFSIPKFSRNEPLEEAITVSVTAKLAKFDQWVQV